MLGKAHACEVMEDERIMRPPRRAEDLAEVAEQYYIRNLTQQQIAENMQITRSNVSRMLQAARDRGIVRFKIVRTLPRQRTLEETLVRTFDIREAIVLSAEAAGDPLPKLGRLAASWLVENVTDGMRVALSWGRTLSAMVDAIDVDVEVDLEVVQLAGDLQLDPRTSGHELVRELAGRFGGRHAHLHAPAILDTPATVRELRSHRGIDAALRRAREADLALVGIGGYGHGFSAQLLESAHLSTSERAAFDRLGPAGDIMGRFFDASGDQLDTPLRDRVLALELEELSKIPTVVGIAGGKDKVAGILGALRAGLLDVLVVDQAAATAVCDGGPRKRVAAQTRVSGPAS